MANRRHVRLVRRGKSAIAEWRSRNPDEVLCLRGAQFVDQDLRKVDLRRANLRNADLQSANLAFANLSKADLRGANLTRANLGGANVRAANLEDAKLCWANLSGTDLRKAQLAGASLNRTDLRETKFSAANLDRADLRNTVLAKREDGTVYFQLATCSGLETTKFSKRDFLSDYLQEAFDYAHWPESYNPDRWYPDFMHDALAKIKALRSLFPESEPPRALVLVIDTITSEAIKYLKLHPNALYDLSSRQFEQLVAEILAHYGWEVQLTKQTRDGGYDIFAVTKEIAGVPTSWIVECKKYSRERKVGIDVVRAMYGTTAVLMHGANILFATTSHFTRDVHEYKASRYDLQLRDYEGILHWIKEYKPNPAGSLYLRESKLILPQQPTG